jgi:hypothetical protein
MQILLSSHVKDKARGPFVATFPEEAFISILKKWHSILETFKWISD